MKLWKRISPNYNCLISSKSAGINKCLCPIEFEDVQPIGPLSFAHQGNVDGWTILEKIQDAVVGTGIPYNYEKLKF